MAENKNQHYVPQVYLREFINPKNIPDGVNPEALWEYDKVEQTIKIKRIKDVFATEYFYSFSEENEQYNHTIEVLLSKFENNYKKIKNRSVLIRDGIINQKRIDWYNKSEFDYLIRFIMVQYFRVPKVISSIVMDSYGEYKRINNVYSVAQKDEEIFNNIKKNMFPLIFDIENQQRNFMYQLISSRNIHLTIIPDEIESDFIITDSPILVTNPVSRNALIHQNTEITIPITKKIAISFYGYGKEKLTRVLTDKNEIKRINLSLSQEALRYCCSGNKKQLEEIKIKHLISALT